MSVFLTSVSLSAMRSGALMDPARDALQRTADKSFHRLLVSSAVVALGVILEAPEATIALKRWFRLRRGKEVAEPNERSWAVPASYLGLLLVIAGVAGEGVFEAKLSNADTALRAHDEQVMGDALMSAGDAKTSADAAKKDASTAKTASDAAVKQSSKANDAATHALTEANTFETGIVSANKNAAKAERDLAGALQQATLAQAELNALKSPRKFLDSEDLLEKLKAFKGTKYGFSGVFSDEESIDLLKALDGLLQKAGWIRQQLPDPYPAVNPYGKLDTLAVSLTLISGVIVSTDSEQTIESLQHTPLALLPKYLQAAEALYSGLSTNLVPPQNMSGEKAHVTVAKGTTDVVVIMVGKKP